MIPQRILPTVIEFNETAHARIIPWAHRLYAWVGLAYLYEDGREDLLIYMTPTDDGNNVVRVHKTKMEVSETSRLGVTTLTLDTDPNPESDPLLQEFEL